MKTPKTPSISKRHGSRLAMAFTTAVLVNWTCAAVAEVITVPRDLENQEGNTSDTSELFGKPLQVRFQQAFDPAAFGPLPGPIRITELRFRNDAERGVPFQGTVGSVEVRVSMIDYPASLLSEVLGENVGANETVVFDRGPLEISSLRPVIPLTTPFVYEPSRGGLLIEIRKYTTADLLGPSYLDAHAYPGRVGPVSWVWGGAPEAPLGSRSLGIGLVFELEFSVVPEPCTVALAGLALLFGVLWKWKG